MGHVDRLEGETSPSVTVEELIEEAGIGMKYFSNAMAYGAHPPSLQSIDDLNAAELNLFTHALASLVPGVDPQIDKARQAVDEAHIAVYGSNNNGAATEALRNIVTTFRNHGLNTSQLEIS